MRRSGGNPRAARYRGIEPEFIVGARDDRMTHVDFKKYAELTNLILDPAFFGENQDKKQEKS